METSMFVGLLLMTFAFWLYTIAVALMRVRSEILERERHSDWVGAVIASEARRP